VVEVDPGQAKRINKILWSVLLAAQLIYVVVGQSGIAPAPSNSVSATIPTVFAFIALAMGGASHFFWRRATGARQPIQTPRPETAIAFRSYLLAWILDEAIAILGLILAFLAVSMSIWAPFSLAAFVLMWMHRPV
jgi:hypothetical protein